jgi:hypothetical protein
VSLEVATFIRGKTGSVAETYHWWMPAKLLIHVVGYVALGEG